MRRFVAAVLIFGLANVPVGAQDNEDFEYALDTVLALTPEQIKKFKEELDARQEAAAQRARGPLVGIEESASYSFDPNVSGNLIFVATGRVTAISFLDASAKSWPVTNVLVGNGEDFEVSVPIKGGGTITIAPKKAYSGGNVVVFLEGLEEPLSLDIQSNELQFHRKYNLSIPSLGPNGLPHKTIAADKQNAEIGGDYLYEFLDGSIPADAKQVSFNGDFSGVEGWLINNELILKTSSNLISPAWHKQVQSASGVNVYALSPLSVLVVQSNGSLKHLEVLNDG